MKWVIASAPTGGVCRQYPVKYGWQKRAMLHAQSGISSDIGTTPGARLPYGDEPDPITHLQTVAPHHAYYYSGISDIPDARQKPSNVTRRHWVQLCLGAFKAGMREFTANVSGNDLVRVTGYMVRLSDLEKYRAEGSRTNTTLAGRRSRTQHSYSGTPAARDKP